MRWLKRNMWKAGIAIAGMLLLLVLMVWVPMSAAGAQERTSGLVTPVAGTAQTTPTEDATVTALNKEKLAQEVQQLKDQSEPDFFGWLRTNASILFSTLVVVFGGLFGLWRWRVDRRDAQDKELEDRRDAQDKELEDRKAERERRDEEQKRWLEDRKAEREKRAEERFQAAVEGLSSKREEAKVGAAITLRTFLRPGYEQFYTQTFDLTVAHLRLSRGSVPLDGEPDNPLPLTTLRQALIAVFKEAFPLARSQNKGSPESLDASRIQLDNSYLEKADLKQVWMLQVSLRKANLWRANLNGADLRGADLREANLREADLRRADLNKADLNRADLREANLNEANLIGVNLSGDIFFKATDLSFAVLSRANLAGAFLKDTNLYRVKGLTKEQLEACKAKGAIIDEDSATSLPQSTVSPPVPPQSNDVQALSPTPAQVNTSTPDTDESSATSSSPSGS